MKYYIGYRWCNEFADYADEKIVERWKYNDWK